MSVYKEIKTEFRNPQSLLAALGDLDITIQATGIRENTTKLISHWHGNPPQDVAIAIKREQARRVGLGDYDGLGFRWTGEGYAIVQDRIDEGNSRIAANMNKLKQRYAFHEVCRQAKAKGYTVHTVEEGGTLRLTLRAR